MKRTLSLLLGTALAIGQAQADPQRDDGDGRGAPGRGSRNAGASANVAARGVTVQQRPAVAARASSNGSMQRMTTTATPTARARSSGYTGYSGNTQTAVTRADIARSSSVPTTRTYSAARQPQYTQSYTTRGNDSGTAYSYRDSGNRTRSYSYGDRGDRVRYGSDSRYYRPPVDIYRGWDRGRVYSWNNHRYHWYGGDWVIYDDAPTVVYSEGLPVVGASLVENVQEQLQGEGYDPGPADGVMGGQTRSAIVAFQRDHGLAVTGTITHGLLRALDLA